MVNQPETESNDTASEDTTMTTTTSSSLPPEARNLTWKDSFYNGQQDIIAVFDYLPNKPCRRVVLHECKNMIIPALAVSPGFFLLALSDNDAESLLIAVIVLGMMAFPLMVGLILGIVRQSRFRNLHFCVTSEGLRVDEDDAGSYTVILFENIIVYQASLENCEHQPLRNLWDPQLGFLVPLQPVSASFIGSPQVLRGGISLSLCGVEQPRELGRLVLALREQNQQQYAVARTPAPPPAVVDMACTTSLQLNGETHSLTWNDRYYEEKPDIVAVFEVDDEKAKRQLARLRVLRFLAVFNLPACILNATVAVGTGSAVSWFALGFLLFLGVPTISNMAKKTMAEQTGLAKHMALMETGIRRDDVNGTYTVTLWQQVQCRLYVYRPTWWNLPFRVLCSQAFLGVKEEYVSWPWAADNARQFVEVVTAIKNRAPRKLVGLVP